MALPELNLPTPVSEVAPGLWVKDESDVAEPYGGNKVRKLRSILAGLQELGVSELVTCGGVGSHHVCATAIYARRAGLVPHAVLFPQTRTSDGERHAACIVDHCETVRTEAYPQTALRTMRALSLERGAAIVPVGGSSVDGTLGWVDGGREIARQVAAGTLPAPRAVWVPSASGGTAAGVAIGLAAEGLRCRVIALRVDTFLSARRLDDLVNRTRTRIVGRPEPCELSIVDARPGPVSVEPGPPLDPRYTTPGWATCLALRDSGGPDLFLHTASRYLPDLPSTSPPPKVDALFRPMR